MKKIISFLMIFLICSFGWSAITLGQLKGRLNYAPAQAPVKVTVAKKHHQPVVENSTEYVIIDLPAPDAQEVTSSEEIITVDAGGSEEVKKEEAREQSYNPETSVYQKLSVETTYVVETEKVVEVEAVSKVSVINKEENSIATVDAGGDGSVTTEAEQTTATTNSHDSIRKRIEHEIDMSVGWSTDGSAHAGWACAEYLAWLNNIAVGLYGAAGEGSNGDYSWNEVGIGPQVGFKKTWADASTKMLRQNQVKLRLIYEALSGENPSSGYHMNQKDLKLGLYAEHIRQVSPKFMWILTAEGWLPLWSQIDSTWDGDSPVDRSMAFLGIYGNYAMDSNFAIRLGGGPLWDGQNVGPFGKLEFRIWDWLRVGPTISLLDGGSPNRGALVGLELGGPIKRFDEKRRIERVKKAEVPSKFDKEF